MPLKGQPGVEWLALENNWCPERESHSTICLQWPLNHRDATGLLLSEAVKQTDPEPAHSVQQRLISMDFQGSNWADNLALRKWEHWQILSG